MSGENQKHGGPGDSHHATSSDQKHSGPGDSHRATSSDQKHSGPGDSHRATSSDQKHSGPGDSHRATSSDQGITPSETARDVRPSASHGVDLADGDANTACGTGTAETESALALTARRDLNSANHDPTGTAAVGDQNTVSRDATAANEGVKAVSRDTSAATHGVSAADRDRSAADPKSSVTCDRDVSVDVEEAAETDGGRKSGKDKDKEEEELAQLLPNSSKESRGEPGDSGLVDGEDGAEVMADVTEDVEGRVENLTQSILDLQGKAEMGADFDWTQRVRRRGVSKYSNSLKTFLPVRPKA